MRIIIDGLLEIIRFVVYVLAIVGVTFIFILLSIYTADWITQRGIEIMNIMLPNSTNASYEFNPYHEKIGIITNFDIAIENSILSSTTHCLVEVNHSEKYVLTCNEDELSMSMCLYRYHGYMNASYLEVKTC